MGFVERPQFVWWRKAVFQVHLWTGVIVGLYVIAISVSGCVLVFQRDFMNVAPRLPDEPKHASRFTYEQIVQAAMNAHPGEPLDSIDLRTGYRRAVEVTLNRGKKQRMVYVDAYSCRIIGEAIREDKYPLLSFLDLFTTSCSAIEPEPSLTASAAPGGCSGSRLVAPAPEYGFIERNDTE